MTAWAPHENQQKPLRPGAGDVRLADALEVDEKPTGDQARPNTKG
jgi:NADH dehydrogenase [ubiquinone] 1 alpha subcomplex assembly factor 5